LRCDKQGEEEVEGGGGRTGAHRPRRGILATLMKHEVNVRQNDVRILYVRIGKIT